jgi:hypothetical protein
MALANANGLSDGSQLPAVIVCPIPNWIAVPPMLVVFTSPPVATTLVAALQDEIYHGVVDNASQIAFIDELIADLGNEISDAGHDEKELSSQLEKLEGSIGVGRERLEMVQRSSMNESPRVAKYSRSARRSKVAYRK